MKAKTCIVIVVIALLSLSGLSWNPAAAASSLKVSTNGITSGDCTTWDNACDLQYALSIAINGDEIWVAAGTYVPGTNRADTFMLKNGVDIYGSLPWGAMSRDQRDMQRFASALSGDIGELGLDTDNIYRIVTGINVTPTATLDGFYILGAYNDRTGTPQEWGGGIYLEDSNVILSNLQILGNWARSGGGMFISGSAPTYQLLDHVRFSLNHASINGGGLHTYYSSALLMEVVFSGNSADNDGGGMYNYYSNPTVINVEYTNNQATRYGGGMHNYNYSLPVVTNATFGGNTAFAGGGLCNEWYSSPLLTNVSFFSNSANSGSAIFTFAPSNATLVNAILWSNVDPQIGGDAITTTYSDIQGGYDGWGDETGNIDLDPMLGLLDYYGGFSRSMSLLPSSPAIDSGSPDMCPPYDQRGMVRPWDGDQDGIRRCDMGSFEYPLSLVFLPMLLSR